MTTPHNLSAEEVVIGSVLFENSTIRFVNGLEPDHFYSTFHGLVWRSMLDLMKAGHAATEASVIEALSGHEMLKGNLPRIEGFVDSAAFGPDIEINVKIIKDTHQRRRLIELAENLKRSAIGTGDGYVEPSEVVLAAQGGLAEVSKDCGGRNKWTGIDAAVESLIESVARSSEQKKPRGLRSGIRNLDQHMGGMRAGDLIVVAGATSMGKTSLARNIAYSVAAEGGEVAFFSQEMTTEQIAARTLSAEAHRYGLCRTAYRDMDQGFLTKSDLHGLREASKRITARLAVDQSPALKSSEILLRSRERLNVARKLDLIVVDYLQIMDITAGRSENRSLAIGNATMAMKNMAKELGVPVILLSQLSREYWKRDSKRPQLSDLRDSGSIEQDADKVMFVHREGYFLERQEPSKSDHEAHYEWSKKIRALGNKLEVIVAKNRMGKVGTVELWIDQATDLVLSDEGEFNKQEAMV